MTKTRTELCEILNEYANRICPKLKLLFEPYMGGQPRVVDAKVKLADIEELANSVSFNMTELNENEGWELEKLFVKRVNSMFVRIAREALNLEITANPIPYLKEGKILRPKLNSDNVVKEFLRIHKAGKSGKALLSCQGQGMDGYSQLAAYNSLAGDIIEEQAAHSKENEW